MPSASEPRLEDIARIAFVTRRFHELKGLKTASIGFGLLLGCLLQQVTVAGGLLHVSLFQVLVVAGMLYVSTTRELDARYRETFGDPVASARRKVNSGTLDVVWYGIAHAGLLADMYLLATRPGPSMVGLTLASCSLFIVIRDWPRRIHHLAVVAAGLAAALVTAAVPPILNLQWYAMEPARGHAFLLGYTLLGLGIVAAGLLDHHLLASALRSAVVVDPMPEERRAAGLTGTAIAALFCAAAGGSLWWFGPLAIGLGLPLVLIFTSALSQTVIAVRDIHRWARSVNARHSVRGRPLNLDSTTLVLMFGVAFAGALDGALASPPLPIALAVAIGIWSASVAVRDWSARKHYLIGAFAALIVLLVIPRELPARGFAVLVFAAAGALAVETLIDHWKATHVHAL